MKNYQGGMNDNWGMMGQGGRMGSAWQNPGFIIGAIVHLAIAVLFFLILLFIAMLLWEKVKAARYANRRQEKGK